MSREGLGQAPQNPVIDDLTPPEIAEKTVKIGVNKAGLKVQQALALAFLAGVFISFGAMISTVVSANDSALPFGLNALIKGLAFSLGLVLVLVAGGELFTGNMLIIMAFLEKKIRFSAMLRNWLLVYFGNFVGSLVMALLFALSKQYSFGGGAIGENLLRIAEAKSGHTFINALILGVLGNTFVCLAVWMAFSARTTSGKIAAVILPISAFVAGGLEHSVANMYFIPVALLVRWLDPNFVAGIGKFGNLTVSNFFFYDLIPVTIGNMIGGLFFVGFFYWFTYLKKGNV